MTETHIMIRASLNLLAPFFLLRDERSSKTSAASIDDRPTLLAFDGWVQTQVLSTRKPESTKVLCVA